MESERDRNEPELLVSTSSCEDTAMTQRSDEHWNLVPEQFQYLRPWVDKYGLMGRTIYGDRPNFEETVTADQLDDLCAAYREVARREDSVAICRWSASVRPMTPENEIATAIIG